MERIKNNPRFARIGMIVLCLGLGVLLAVAANKNWTSAELGDLSQYYEIGDSADPGKVARVAGDPGGPSYGIYMFAGNSGTPMAFANWLMDSPKSLYQEWGNRLYKAYNYNAYNQWDPGYGANFDATWKAIAAENKEEFMRAQKDYWYMTYYLALVGRIEAKYAGFDMDDYGIALQNVFWSRSVQHGVSGAETVITKAFTTLGGFKSQSETVLIRAIYAECSKLEDTKGEKYMSGAAAEKYGVSNKTMAYYYGSSGDIQLGVYTRLHVNEPSDAVVMRYQNFDGQVADGVYQLLDYGNQNRGISENGTVSLAPADAASAAQKWTLTYYGGGFYTITMGDKRLADEGGFASISDASSSKNQQWIIEKKDGAYTVKNRSTERYLSISEGVLVLGKDSYAWHLKQLGDVIGIGLFYPGSEEGVTNRLIAGNSSFPVRGTLISALPLSSVTVKAVGTGGAAGFTATKSNIGTNYFNLWDLDSSCTISGLSAGEYTFTITATTGDGKTVTVASDRFSVLANSGSTVDDETFTVTFDANGGTCKTASKTYKLTNVYGDLPVATKEGYDFVGWFMDDGTEVTNTTMVAARNHTLHAKYGDLYTVTFKNEDGSVLKTVKLAQGELIIAPATNPMKDSDTQYVYSFKCWQDEDGNQFVADKTYMGTAAVVYTPVFEKTENTGGNGYWTGITPKTPVTALTGQGYTIKNGSTTVTGGDLMTGMTATKSGGVSVTIVVTGDTNGDGVISITDVVKLQSHVVGKSALSGAFAEAGDLNRDGKITITDVVQAAQITVGKRTIG